MVLAWKCGAVLFDRSNDLKSLSSDILKTASLSYFQGGRRQDVNELRIYY